MRSTLAISFMLAFVAFASPGMTATSDAKDTHILAALKAYGAIDVMDDFQDQMVAGMESYFEKMGDGLPDQKRAALLDLARETFASERLQEIVITHFRDHYDRKRLAGVEKTMGSPLAQRMLKLELTSLTDDQEGLINYANNLSSNPPADARVQRLLELDDVGHVSEMAVAMQMAAIQAAVDMLVAYGPGGDSADATEIQSMLADTEDQLRTNIRQVVLLTMLYVYRDASDGELNDYVDLHKEAHMQWFISLFHNAMTESMSKTVSAYMERIAVEFSPGKKISRR